MLLNLKIIVRTGEDLSNKQVLYKKMRDIRIGKLPIMLKSGICVLTQFNHLNTAITGECKYDPGGHFIVSGQEKIIVAIEKMVDNKILVFKKKDLTYPDKVMFTAQINSKKINHIYC